MRWRAAAAMAGKDLRVVCRQPLFAVIIVLVSTLFVAMYALIVQVSATTPIAVADEADSPASAALLEVLSSMDSVDGEMLEIRTTDPVRARQLFDDGRVSAVLELPVGLDGRLDAREPVTLPLTVRNINSDLTKNVELRAERAVREFAAAHTDAQLVEVHETRTFASDMRVSTYLGTALLVFAVVFAGTVSAGTLLTSEWEGRTAKTAVLSPGGPVPLILGKWLAALAQSTVSLLVVLGALALVLDYPVWRLGGTGWTAVATLWAYGASLGALLGVLLRRSLPLVPLSVVIAVVHLLASGYESYIRGFAHGGAIEVLWQATHWWPVATLADDIRFAATGVAASPNWAALAATLGVAGAVGLAAVARLRRQLGFAQGQ